MCDSTSGRLAFQLPLLDFRKTPNPYYNKRETAFCDVLSCLRALLSPGESAYLFRSPSVGRKGYTGFQILGCVLLKSHLRLATARGVLDALRDGPNWRLILGLGDDVPSEGCYSRRVAELEHKIDMSVLHGRLASAFFDGRLVCNLSVDSTPVDACEKPAKKPKKEKRKRGRKARGSAEEAEYRERARAEQELKELRDHGDERKYLGTLEKRCTVTGKRNSKGNMDWRIGYKAHLAVDDNGIPVAYAVTGACVSDMKPAIPLLRMADRRCAYLYALMDAGYWSEEIAGCARGLGKVPVIDARADRNGDKPEMDPAKRLRYQARTTVERANSELKQCFLPDRLRSRGYKARLDIEAAILLLSMKRMRMVLERERKAA